MEGELELLLAVLPSVVMATLGALARVLVQARRYRDVYKFEAVRTLVLGVIVGILYGLMRREHGLPDSAASFAVGYMARDFIDYVARRYRPVRGRATQT